MRVGILRTDVAPPPTSTSWFFIKIFALENGGVDIPTVVPRMSYSSGSVSIVGIQLTGPRKSIESSSVDRPKNGEMRHTRESYFGWAMHQD